MFFFSDFPCNYLPCLEMDGGFRMPETMSICRYIARQYGKWDLIQFSSEKFIHFFICNSTIIIFSYLQQWLPYFRFNNSNCKIITVSGISSNFPKKKFIHFIIISHLQKWQQYFRSKFTAHSNCKIISHYC